MSDTTSAPAPAGGDSGATSAPPASTQPSLSISEAGRLLRQQRVAAGEPAATPAEPTRRPSANELVQATKDAAQKPADAAAPAAAVTKAATGLSAMERALGVPGVAAPEGTPATPPATPAIGGEVEIEGQRYNQAQLREFVLKASDYTQKTQALAQERQALAAQQQALATVLPYIQPELAKLAEQLQRADVAQMPDPSLAHTDPTAYVQQRAAYDAAVAEQQRLGNLTALQQQAAARAMEAQVAQANEQLANEFAFWRDPQQRLEAQQAIVTWATSKGGFSREELRGLSDPRALKIMMKASMFDKMMDGTKTTAPTPQLAAPVRGSPPPPPPTARIQAAEQAFEQRPNWRSGAALLAARRGNGQAR